MGKLSSVCNGCNDLTMLCPNLSNTAIITVKGVDYHCIIHGINKSDTFHLLGNLVLYYYGYLQNANQRINIKNSLQLLF